jgi:hypothetical protein
MLLALGSTAALVARVARGNAVRAAAGAVMIAFGLVQTAHTAQAWVHGQGGQTPACCPRHHSG